MRCLIVGCGSIGSRRARILADMGHDLFLVDADDRVEFPLAREIGARAMGHLAAGLSAGPDAVFVCTPPATHVVLARRALEAEARGLFVEKPLALDADERLDALVAESRDTVTMGACNLRFDARLAALPPAQPDSLHLTMHQHRRHWSPSHEPVSLALDSIHELDLAVHLAGPVESIAGASDLDRAEMTARHTSGCVTRISLSRLSEPPTRSVEWVGRVGDGVEHHRIDLWPPDDDMYRREMEHFLACVERGTPTRNPLEQAASTLRRALRVAKPEAVAP